MKLFFSEKENQIFKLLGKAAKKIDVDAYLVGGFVRDQIIHRESKDIDVVCVGSGIRLAETFATMLQPKPNVAVFKRFGTAMLKFGDFEIEFVGARKESYAENSRKPAVEEGTLEDDQWRRDFSINALAVSLQQDTFGEVVDPFGGIEDIENRRIVTPCEPEKTFSDDPLRMLRAVRFASQLQFNIDPVTFKGIQNQARRLNIISKERIHTEFNKILLSPIPSLGLSLLEQTNLLQYVLPELLDLKGVEVRKGIGHKDNFYHTLEVVDNIALLDEHNLWLRWAALLHDIAKPPTKRFQEGHGWTFHGHEVIGAKMVPKIFKRLKLPLDHKMKYVQKLVHLHLRPISLTKSNITDSAVRRLLFDAGDDIDDLMLLCHADVTSKNEFKKKRFRANYQLVKERLKAVEENDKIRNWQPPISGEEIMTYFNIPPSRSVGIIKDAIREAILDGKLDNNYTAALDFMKIVGKQILDNEI